MNVSGAGVSGVKPSNDNSTKRQDTDLVDLMELVGNSHEQRNWRGIFLSILVILIIFSLVITAVIMVMPKTEKTIRGEPFTLEDLFNPAFQPRKLDAKWIGDDDYLVYRTPEGDLVELDPTTNSTTIILDNATFRDLNCYWYSVSSDRRYVLLAYDVQKLYRHSFLARYKVFDRHALGADSRLVPFPFGEGVWTDTPLQFADWSPNGQALSFVIGNNLYYQSSVTAPPVAVTDDGDEGRIINGLPDWLYEEEILHGNTAHWWSQAGTYICFARFDDTGVPVYRFPYYGDGDDIYGHIKELSYPKAGDTSDGVNPVVRLFLVTLNSAVGLKEFHAPQDLGPDHYFTQVTWQDETHVMITWTNRAQTKALYTICDAISADCHLNQIDEIDGGRGWVDTSVPIFLGDQRYITTLPGRDSQYGFWKHIALITTPVGSEGSRSYLTQGTWDVISLLAADQTLGDIFYISTNGDPRQRHLFRINLLEHEKLGLQTPECLTCEYDSACQYVSASFSPSTHYYLLHCEGPGIPYYVVRSTLNHSEMLLEDNWELRNLTAEKEMPVKEYLEIEVDGGVKLWAQMILPPVLNREHIVLYPLLVHTYGGPGSQLVTDQYFTDWCTYLASQAHVICMSIDGRGTLGRGNMWLHSIHGNLGTLEVQDQIAGAIYARDNFAYVDPERIAIWGWSYGGFVALHALADRDSSVFSCGVAVAPITDWHYYDTAYTERYMGLQRDNYKGYDNANVSWKAANLYGKQLLLIHGTADDNVHFQHSAQFIKALTAADVDYQLQLYSDRAHALSGSNVERHMHRSMTQFLMESCWDGGSPRLPEDEEAT